MNGNKWKYVCVSFFIIVTIFCVCFIFLNSIYSKMYKKDNHNNLEMNRLSRAIDNDLSKVVSLVEESKSIIIKNQNECHKINLINDNLNRKLFVTFKELIEIEKNFSYKEIWILTSVLLADITEFSDVVKSNLDRGIKYVHFVPNTNLIEARMERLKNFCSNHKLDIVYVDNKYFSLLPPMYGFVIYNPIFEHSSEIDGYIWLGEENNNKKIPYIKMDYKTLDELTGVLKKCYNEYKNKK